jgi:formylmethanofuran dehydrogenase subunit E
MASEEPTMDLRPIGVVHSPFNNREDCPANGWASDTHSEIQIASNYLDGLTGLETGMRIHVLWWFTRADRDVLAQQPEPEAEERGVFAMRSPERPNPLALSLCEIIEFNRDRLVVVGLEAIDGSPVVDIKQAVEFEGKIL